MDELERLKNTIESTKAVLLDAEDKQEQNHGVQNWIRRLKDDVLHPADDLLDEFFIEDMRYKKDEVHKNKVTKVLHSLSPNTIAFRRKMAQEIGKLQKKFNDVVKDMSGLNLNPNVVVVDQTNSVRRESSSFVLESDIIGREDDKNKIISLLRQSDENQNVSLIAIVGIGGLGKTALAQLIYNDGEVKSLFEMIMMWVCVSENFEVKTIVRKMLESFTKSKIDDTLSLDNLQNMLRDKLTGKKYLLVLDDIWNESYEKWAQLRTYLMCGAQGSKVVVTTRSKIVAERMGVSVPYALNGLNPKKSWSLLKSIITYGDETKGVNQTLEPIGKKIAEKCIGVPLAIRTLGGLLQSQSEEKEWINVLQGDFWKLCEDEDSIMPVLKRSYQNLSSQLRQCFAYCALYPKDRIIVKDELIKLWMAQGYLECSAKNQPMEDIGNQFVKILLMKSFFQDAEIDDCGDICSFKMHDLIHDLAMKVAGNDCCYLDRATKRLVGSPMHVMLESDAIGLLESLNASRMRTLIVLLSNYSDILDEKQLSIISNFKYLRVLKLSSCSLSMFSDSFDKLKHLRYLNLQCYDRLGSLSKSIGNLVCLQTLILGGRLNVEITTKFVSKLANLRHLEFDTFEVSKEKKATSRFGKLVVGKVYKSVIFSNWIFSLTNIVEISLNYSQGLQFLPPMERLPFLKSLDICHLNKLEYMYCEEPLLPESFFPSLETLKLYACVKLRGWLRMNDDVNDYEKTSSSRHLSFPPFSSRLSVLKIIGCPMLTCMPTFPNLDKKLVLTDTSVETLEATLNMAGSKHSIDFPSLSMLRHLILCEVNLDMKKLPMAWVQNLTALEHLELWWLPSQTFREIENWFEEYPNYLPSLRNIEFWNCSDLKALPDWICKLCSLQHVIVKRCKKLASLPEGMSRLIKLQTLEILGCPLLIEECRTETSAAWPQIAHIPNIILNRYKRYSLDILLEPVLILLGLCCLILLDFSQLFISINKKHFICFYYWKKKYMHKLTRFLSFI